MTVLRQPIAVGVDGSPGSHAAIEWAVYEARRRDGAVRLVNAYGAQLDYRQLALYGNLPLPNVNFMEVHAKKVVVDAAKLAAKLAPEVVVTKEIVGDRAAHALIGASEDAARSSSDLVGSAHSRPFSLARSVRQFRYALRAR